MIKERLFEGRCLCGSVKLEVSGPPKTAGICHCESCRSWHAAPLNSWALWKNENVAIVEGEALLEGYDTGTSHRFWCRRCGSGMLNRKPKGWTVVYATVLAKSGYVHEPSCHIHCQESVFDVSGGLPKYKDLPSKWGGSGESVSE
ncbi:MAG: GFA family protein [Verrucomicrobiia bacterium]|jgi:hypothetical protein